MTAQDGAVPESLWQGPAQTDTVLVIDSRRRLRVDVPSSWRDVRQYPSYNDDGSDRPRIVASLHIDTMLQQWEVPGVIFVEYPYVDPGASSRTSSRARPHVRRRLHPDVRQRHLQRVDADVESTVVTAAPPVS